MVTNSVDLENIIDEISAQESGVLVPDCTKEVDVGLGDINGIFHSLKDTPHQMKQLGNTHQQQRSYNANKNLHSVTLKNGLTVADITSPYSINLQRDVKQKKKFSSDRVRDKRNDEERKMCFGQSFG